LIPLIETLGEVVHGVLVTGHVGASAPPLDEVRIPS
jgi:hypothetical protein